MDYIHTTTTEPVIEHLIGTLTQRLSDGQRVLWLLSGGSGAKVCLEVAKGLTDMPLDTLFVTLSDERYGPIGHPDENWQQLLDNGFALPGATLYRPLIGKDRGETARAFGDRLQQYIHAVDYRIGLFGVGPDGHTAGIKPRTSAVDAPGWTTDFIGEDFERITMTFAAVRHLDEVVIQAMGPDKASTLDQLLHTDTSPSVQPAQVLKQVKKSTLYTDYKES